MDTVDGKHLRSAATSDIGEIGIEELVNAVV